MHQDDIEIWWASLPITQKERIACKGISKSTGVPAAPEQYQYPACSVWWEGLEVERRQKIHDHCVDRHGYLLPDWNDAEPYGD